MCAGRAPRRHGRGLLGTHGSLPRAASWFDQARCRRNPLSSVRCRSRFKSVQTSTGSAPAAPNAGFDSNRKPGSVRIGIGRGFEDLVTGGGRRFRLVAAARDHRERKGDRSRAQHPVKGPRPTAAIVGRVSIAQHDTRWEVDENERFRVQAREALRSGLRLPRSASMSTSRTFAGSRRERRRLRSARPSPMQSFAPRQ